jgi:hypothetical protein
MLIKMKHWQEERERGREEARRRAEAVRAELEAARHAEVGHIAFTNSQICIMVLLMK